jgi:hypothetical protein
MSFGFKRLNMFFWTLIINSSKSSCVYRSVIIVEIQGNSLITLNISYVWVILYLYQLLGVHVRRRFSTLKIFCIFSRSCGHSMALPFSVICCHKIDRIYFLFLWSFVYDMSLLTTSNWQQITERFENDSLLGYSSLIEVDPVFQKL